MEQTKLKDCKPGNIVCGDLCYFVVGNHFVVSENNKESVRTYLICDRFGSPCFNCFVFSSNTKMFFLAESLIDFDDEKRDESLFERFCQASKFVIKNT